MTTVLLSLALTAHAVLMHAVAQNVIRSPSRPVTESTRCRVGSAEFATAFEKSIREMRMENALTTRLLQLQTLHEQALKEEQNQKGEDAGATARIYIGQRRYGLKEILEYKDEMMQAKTPESMSRVCATARNQLIADSGQLGPSCSTRDSLAILAALCHDPKLASISDALLEENTEEDETWKKSAPKAISPAAKSESANSSSVQRPHKTSDKRSESPPPISGDKK